MSGLKKLWGPLKGRWVKPEVREAVVELVDYGIRRVGMPRKRLLRWLGLAPGEYYDWKHRQGQPNRHNGQIPSRHWLQAWEREAIIRSSESLAMRINEWHEMYIALRNPRERSPQVGPGDPLWGQRRWNAEQSLSVLTSPESQQTVPAAEYRPAHHRA